MSKTSSKTNSINGKLLLSGVVAGPMFIITMLVQDFTRPGFNPMLHLLSQLSLGSWGWVQVTNFILAGVLNVLYSIGLVKTLRDKKSGIAAAIFVGLFGIFLIVVGIFRTDPAHGFPPGSITPIHPSGHGVIHALGALFTFLSLTIATFIFSRFFFVVKEHRFAFYCLISAILVFSTFIIGMSQPTILGPALQLAVIIGWSAPSFIALKLLNSQSKLQ